MHRNTYFMPGIDHIKQLLSPELKQFDTYFNQVMKTDVPLLNLVINYLLRRKGKQMRPLLVFLSAKLLGEPTQSTYNAAALIEILHTATLIHDDVVDESNERRGFFSINALWKSKVAVLVGDYLLAKGMLLAIHNKEYDILNLVSDAVKEMSEGELLQLRRTRKLNLTETDYFEIIRKKTATLIACCSSSGAQSVGAPAETVEAMKEFGEKLGIAFQIKDDLLDYQINSLTGKPAGKDIQDKKLTLPLIYALQQANGAEKTKILRIINNPRKNKQTFSVVLDFINKYKGIASAEKTMHDYATMALHQLDKFPNAIMRQALHDFVGYTIGRNK